MSEQTVEIRQLQQQLRAQIHQRQQAESERDRLKALLDNSRDSTIDPDAQTARAQLQYSQTLHQLILSTISDAVFIVDGDGHFTYICPNIHIIFGYDVSEVAQMEQIDRLLGDLPLDRLDADGEIANLEREITDKFGRVHSLLIDVKRVSIGSGTTLYTCRDISDRKFAEAQLRQKTAELEAIFTALPDLYFRLDADGRFLDYRAGGDNQLYVPPEQFMGRTVREVLPPEIGEQYDRAIDRLGQTRKRVTLEHTLPMVSGRRWYEARLLPFGDREVIAVVREVTQNKNTEDALNQSEAKFRTLAATTSAAIFIYQGEYIIYVNSAAERITGYSDAELLGMKLWELVHPDFQEVVRQRQLNRQQGETVPPHYEIQIVTKTGESRWLDFSASLMHYCGQGNGLVTAFDISDRRRSLMALQHFLEHLETHVQQRTAQLSDANRQLQWEITKRQRVQDALHRSEDLFRTLFDRAPIGIMRVAPDGRILLANAKFAEIVGYSTAELEGKTVQEVTHPDDVDKDIALARRLFAGEIDTFSLEQRYIRADGSEVWVDLTTSVVRDREGSIQYGIGTVADITPRKTAEQRVRQSQEWMRRLAETSNDWIEKLRLFKGIIENSNEAIAIRNRQGELVYINPAHEKLFGYPLEVACQLDPTAYYPDATIACLDRQVFPTIARGETWEGELEARDITGRQFVLWERADTIRDPAGNVLFSFGLMHDVSDRKSMEARWRQSEARYRRIVETSQEGIWTIDSEANTTYVNPQMANLLGLRVEDMLGRSLFELTDASTHAEIQRLLQRRQAGIVEQHDFWFRRADGSDVWTMVSTTPMFDENGRYKGALATVADISDRKRAEAQVRASAERLRTVIETVGEGITLSDESGYFAIFNSKMEKITGYSRQEVESVGDFLALLYPNLSDRHQALAGIRAIVQQGGAREVETTIRAKDGTAKTLLVSTSLMREEGKQWFLSAYRDISDRERDRQAIERKTAHLAEAQKVASVGSWELDPLTRAIQWSEQACRIVGVDPRDCCYCNESLDWLHPDDKPLWKVLVNRCLRDRKPYEMELRVVQPLGFVRHVFVKGKPMFDEQGQVVRLFGTLLDITVRKRAEEALRQSKLLIQRIIDASPLILYVHDLHSGANVYVNYRVFDILGYSPETIQQQGAQFFRDNVHPEDYHLFERYAHRFAGVPEGEVIESEYRIRNASGEWRWLRCRDLVFARGKDNHPQQVLGVAEDISDRKSAEQAIAESEGRFRQLAETVQDVFWIFCPKTNRVLYVSPAYETIWGRSCESLYQNSTNWLEFILPEDLEEVKVKQQRILQGESVTKEYRIARPDGEIRWICDRAFPIRDDLAQVYRIVGIAEDITERRRAELQIQDSLREKEVLLKEIHHRVKNNMQVICSLLDMQSRYIDNSKTVTLLQESKHRIYSMALIHEKLYRSQNLDRINFSEYLQTLSHNLIQSFGDRAEDIELDTQFDPAFVNIETAIPCGLIVNELISNAIKYAFKKTETGRVEVILVTKCNSKFTLKVNDNGCGLPDNLDIDKSESLGLRLVKILTRQLRGKLTIYNHPGALFQIEFSELSYRQRI